MTLIRKKKINTTLLLSPSEIDADWKEHLLVKVRSMLSGKCMHEHGYILHVYKITKILDQHITRIDGYIRFFLTILVAAMKPNVGDEIDATVEMIFPHGIFCFYKMMRMMVPISKCHGLTIRHDFSMTCLHNPSLNITIRKNNIIHVRIDDVRFENDFYSCIVSLCPSKDKEGK